MGYRSRAARAMRRRAPDPVHSTRTTPLASADSSTYTSEDEFADGGSGTAAEPKKLAHEVATRPFRFLDLPAELRLKVYRFHFEDCGDIVDHELDNHHRIGRKLALMATCKQVNNEATCYFFGSRTFRIFQKNGFFFKKKPLLARLTLSQRANIKSLELFLGPCFTGPPRAWTVNRRLGLKDCTAATRLKVFVELDPSNEYFSAFRLSNGFYEDFSRRLLDDILAGLPVLKTIELDAAPSCVEKSGAMVQGLLEVIQRGKCKLSWGQQCGWSADETPIRL